ncbi:prenyltransferase [Candidatus Nanosalina sp. VS9-1]|uniref:prenyltransferase n=1 Tax=Candidatus Nanosalina sp. VS9-1 TaxID=3388566 RepID=UPI0039DFB67B
MKNEIRYLLKLSRPRFWLYLAGPAMIGLILGSGSIEQLYSIENLLLLIYFLIPANIMLYGVNDYFDRDVDEDNPKKDDKEERYRGSTFTDLSVGLSTALSIPVIILLPSEASAAMMAFLALSIGYSAPPLRFKARPFLDSLSNGLYIFPFVVSYAAVTSSLPALTAVAAGWLWAMAMHTFSAIPDIEPDRKAGVATTATFLGRKKTFVYCTAVWSLSGIVAGLWNFWTGLLFSVYPLICVIFYFSGLEDSEAYWYYPYINAFLGMILSIAGLWVLVHG